MHMDLEVTAPIVIGSIPLRSTFSDFSHGAEYQQQESGNPFFQAYPDLRKTTADLCWVVLKFVVFSAPPSYNMANFGYEVEDDIVKGGDSSSDEEGKGATQGYAPSYLTYGFQAPNQAWNWWASYNKL